MKKFLILSLIALSVFGFQSSTTFANSYEQISFKSKNEFLLSLRAVLSESFSEDEVQKGLNAFNFRDKIRNFEDFDTLIAAQPTNAETIIANVKMLNLVNKPTELNIIKSEIYEIAKNSATSVSLMDSPMIAAVAVVPALAIFSNSTSGPSLSINDVTTSDETASDATFTVTLSEVSEDPVTVNYATSNGTATAGSDYTAVSSTTLTFNPGETNKVFNIAVLADSLDEANETVQLTLSSANNANISDGTGTLTITDDDSAPFLSINDVTKAEVVGSSTTATFAVTLSAASGKTVTVKYATSDGTATAGTDYTAITGTSLIFNAGDTSKTFNVTVLADTSYENSESATLTLSNASNAMISDATGTLTITDNFLNSGTQLTYSASAASTKASSTEFRNINNDHWGGIGYAHYLNEINPLEIINAHKAHGYGLTGSGKTVLIIDSEFDSDHGDLNDPGKVTIYGSVTECSSSSASCHGAAIGGIIAADNSNDNTLVGVAPSAKLINASSGSTFTAKTNALNHASAAVAVNNSWGFNNSLIDDEIVLMNSNGWSSAELVSYRFKGHTAHASYASTWIAAMNNFQEHGVIVFSNSNTSANDNAEITAALPELFPELGEAFIAAVNIDIGGTAGDGTYVRKSAPCGDAAPYCLAADAHAITTLGANSGYTYYVYDSDSNGSPDIINSGTSYVAPMISGAVAIMAEAFPNMTPANWTDRLLASANNKIGYSEIGRTTFGNGVVHGYSHDAGHGILDIYAALQPITSTSYAQVVYAGAENKLGQSFTLNSSRLSGSQSFGDAIKNALKDEDTYFYDALDGGFKFSLDQLVKDAKLFTTNNAKLVQHNIKPVRDEWKSKEQDNGHEKQAFKKNYFDASVNTQSKALTEFFDSGKSYTLGNDTYFLPFMTNIQGGSGANLGLKLRDGNGFLTLSSVRTPNSESALPTQNAFVATYEDSLKNFGSYGLMLGNVNEGSSFLGTSGTGAFNLDNSISKTSIMNAKVTLNLSPNSTLGLMSGISKSHLNKGTEGLITGIEEVVSDSFALSYNILRESKVDKLSFSLSQPHRIKGGSMDVQIAGLSDKNGKIPYQYKRIGLKPSGRQLDFSFGYTRDLSPRMTVSSQLSITKDAGHRKSNQTNGSIYFGLVKQQTFGDDTMNFGAVLSDSLGETNAKINYSLNW